MLTFPDAVRTCLTKYAVFNGRATRSEYWFFVLFAFLVVVAASILDSILNIFAPVMGGNMLASLAMLALLLPQLSLSTAFRIQNWSARIAELQVEFMHSRSKLNRG